MSRAQSDDGPIVSTSARDLSPVRPPRRRADAARSLSQRADCPCLADRRPARHRQGDARLSDGAFHSGPSRSRLPRSCSPQRSLALDLATPRRTPHRRAGTHRPSGARTHPQRKRQALRQDIAVDDVRRSVSFFGSTAGEGGWRVAIVDAVDELNASGANALLKMLEEPPAARAPPAGQPCPRPGAATIRSRCRRLLSAAAAGGRRCARRRRGAGTRRPAIRRSRQPRPRETAVSRGRSLCSTAPRSRSAQRLLEARPASGSRCALLCTALADSLGDERRVRRLPRYGQCLADGAACDGAAGRSAALAAWRGLGSGRSRRAGGRGISISTASLWCLPSSAACRGGKRLIPVIQRWHPSPSTSPPPSPIPTARRISATPMRRSRPMRSRASCGSTATTSFS